MGNEAKVLLVDLNNFARYPTLPIGYLASILRRASMSVEVFAPLMVGVHGTTRESRPHRFSLVTAKLNHIAATSSQLWVRRWRDQVARRQLSGITAHQQEVLVAFQARLEKSPPRAVMISTYLMYRDVCAAICAMCHERKIPVLIGGPYFVQPETISDWVQMEGLSGLVAGELETEVPAILNTLLHGGDASQHVGVFVADDEGKPKGRVAPPRQELDQVPFPDYSDFPWTAYPNRIIPVITGRGCGWGACSFCSDITSTAGRTYRSRSPENVLGELAQHYQRYGVSRFVFTDLKLNSNLGVWRAIIGDMQNVAPGGQWIGSVHAGTEPDNGLSAQDLRDAAKAGCTRLTTGLESGSQRISDAMKKGTRLDTVIDFLQSAASAGISTRCTMIMGYPHETAEDIHASANFLARHSRDIERISINRLQVITGTSLHRALKRSPHKFKTFSIVQENGAMAQVEHRHETVGTRPHRKAVMRLLTEVHRINSRELSPRAREFEGVM